MKFRKKTAYPVPTRAFDAFSGPGCPMATGKISKHVNCGGFEWKSALSIKYIPDVRLRMRTRIYNIFKFIALITCGSGHILGVLGWK